MGLYENLVPVLFEKCKSVLLIITSLSKTDVKNLIFRTGLVTYLYPTADSCSYTWMRLPYFGNETWQLVKGPEVAYIYTLFLHCSTSGDRNWAYFHPTGIGFWDTSQFSILAYLGMKLSHWQKFQMHIYSLPTPWGQNWAYFHSTGSTFQEQFSKLPYLGMKLGHWQKIQKLHIYPPSTPQGQNWAYFHITSSVFRDTDPSSKLIYLGTKLGHCQKL